MMENKKKISFAIMALAILMIALVVWFVIQRNNQNQAEIATINQGGELASSSEVINTSTPGTRPRDYRKFDISKEPKREADAEAVKKIAMSFAERFGSFSNHSNYSNLEDLKIFMTKNMGEWSDGYLAAIRKEKSSTGEYYGVITKAVSASVSKFDNVQGQAEVLVITRRQETKGNNVGAYFDQQLVLKMAKEGGVWKADSASWQK